MNPRQRQGLLLVVIAAAGLLGVFLLIANYVSTVSRQVGPKISVLRLVAPLPAYQLLSANDLGEVSVPQKWAPGNAITDPSQVIGMVSQVALPSGTELEQGMLSPHPALTPGHREIAILVDPETGVAGQVTPGALVDIVATFQGAAAGQAGKDFAEVVVPGAEVLNVATPTADSASGAVSSSNSGAVPVTFSLTPEQVLKVSYAESFAQKVRLSIVAPNSGPANANPPPYAATP